MNSDVPAEALFGIPNDYVYLLVGMAIGFLLGWLTGRLTAGEVREIGLPSQDPSEASPAAGRSINLVINGRAVNLDPAQATEIQGLIESRKTIDAIKRLREITGLGLAEAKAVADSLAKVRG